MLPLLNTCIIQSERVDARSLALLTTTFEENDPPIPPPLWKLYQRSLAYGTEEA
jgi:hypothetical protein